MIRAWLIALIREAVRAELKLEWQVNRRIAEGKVSGGIPGIPTDIPRGIASVRLTPEPIMTFELSFEQMQEDALKAQKEHYEPRQD